MFPVTAGVLEIFVAGVTAMLWFVPLVAMIAGWKEPPPWLDGGSVALIAFVTLAYGLGVIVDGVSDGLFNLIRTRSTPALGSLSSDAFGRLREEALVRDDGLSKFLEYQRNRMRIARALTLNFLLLLPVGVWFLAVTIDSDNGPVVGFGFAVALGVASSGYVQHKTRTSYEKQLQRLPMLLGAKPLAHIRAAGVCVHASGGAATRFLLVTTKETGVERWTFPKGHLESGESLLEAALREVEEEAGVRGVIDPEPLTAYVFPGGSELLSIVVIPFLVDVREEALPTERGRTLQWVPPDEAKELLRSNREARFRHEHDRVIDAALERLRVRSRIPSDL